jgi:hypothetical protein
MGNKDCTPCCTPLRNLGDFLGAHPTAGDASLVVVNLLQIPLSPD